MLLAILLFTVTHNDAIRPIHTAKSNMRRWEHGHGLRHERVYGKNQGPRMGRTRLYRTCCKTLSGYWIKMSIMHRRTRGARPKSAQREGRMPVIEPISTKNRHRDALQSAGSRSRSLQDTPSTAAKMHNLHFYPVFRQLPYFRAVLTPSAPYRRMNRSG